MAINSAIQFRLVEAVNWKAVKEKALVYILYINLL